MQNKIAGIATVILILAVVIGAAVAAGVSADSTGILKSAGPGPGIIRSENVAMDGAYENNETITSPAGTHILEEHYLDHLDYTNEQAANRHYGPMYAFTIRQGYNVYLIIPFSNAFRKNGRNVAVQYLWYKLNMPVGVNVTETAVNSGGTSIYYSTQIRQGTGVQQWYLINLGARRLMPEGATIKLAIRNDAAGNQTVYSYGARLLQEW